MKVLVADSVKLIQQMIASLFSGTGLEPVVTSTGKGCIDALESDDYAFICISMHMSDTNGIELSKKIRSSVKYAHTPIILFTSEHSSAMLSEAIQAGVTEIFDKTTDLEQLVAYIKRFTLQYTTQEGHILYVEDSKSLRLTTVNQLKAKGYTVDAFSKAESAWMAFQKKTYDLVITDIVLAGQMSGLALANKIRRLQDRRGDTPILAITGFDDISRRIELFHMGVNDYAIKPVVEEELLARIRYLIGSSKSIDRQLTLVSDIFDYSPDGIAFLNNDHQIKQVNNSFKMMTGLSNEDLFEKDLIDFEYPELNENALSDIWRFATQNGVWIGEYNLVSSALSEPMPCLLSIYKVASDSSVISEYIAIWKNISQEKNAERKIEYLSTRDSLTGLPNRNSFLNFLNENISSEQAEQHFALLWLDINKFEFVNNSLGHAIGDAVLQELSSRLSSAIEGKGQAYRIAGDEFCLVMTSSKSLKAISAMAQQVIETVHTPFKIEDKKISLQTNIGISRYPDDAKNIDELTTLARSSMNYARSQFDNEIQFTSKELAKIATQRMQFQLQLHHAFDNEEFELLYQPLLEIESNKIIGAEALIRWENPVLGTITPEKFLPIAEEMGLMVKIGDWVMETVCRQMAEWKASGLNDLKISLNFSPTQMLDPLLKKKFLRLLNQYELDPHHFKFEITETTLMQDRDKITGLLTIFQSLGIDIALDDFGTGYSSLAYLTQLPVTTLKIDKSFIDGLPDNNDSISVVLTIIELARQFKLEVIAEGVEQNEQLAFLKMHHCDVIQGYLTGKPVRPEMLRLPAMV